MQPVPVATCANCSRADGPAALLQGGIYSHAVPQRMQAAKAR